MSEEKTELVPIIGNGPEDGMGDDEELQIGGKVAGMRQGPVVETTVQQEVSNTVSQNVVTVSPSMQMVMDPNMAAYG